MAEESEIAAFADYKAPQADAPAPAAPAPAAAAPPPPPPPPAAPVGMPAPAPAAPVARTGERVFSSPLARRLAAEKGIDVSVSRSYFRF